VKRESYPAFISGKRSTPNLREDSKKSLDDRGKRLNDLEDLFHGEPHVTESPK